MWMWSQDRNSDDLWSAIQTSNRRYARWEKWFNGLLSHVLQFNELVLLKKWDKYALFVDMKIYVRLTFTEWISIGLEPSLIRWKEWTQCITINLVHNQYTELNAHEINIVDIIIELDADSWAIACEFKS